jgi:hypothetical protein
MSLSVGGASNALSSVQSFLQQTSSKIGNTDPSGGLFGLLAGMGPSASSDASSASSSSAARFDPSTFSTLLDAQGQAGSASSSGGSAHAAGGSGGSDPTSSPGDQNADGSTTQTIVNANGSVTTITTYPDGTSMQSTAPAATTSGNLNAASNEVAQQLDDLASAVIPTAISLATLL